MYQPNHQIVAKEFGYIGAALALRDGLRAKFPGNVFEIVQPVVNVPDWSVVSIGTEPTQLAISAIFAEGFRAGFNAGAA